VLVFVVEYFIIGAEMSEIGDKEIENRLLVILELFIKHGISSGL
jgi:hypothetical protein